MTTNKNKFADAARADLLELERINARRVFAEFAALQKKLETDIAELAEFAVLPGDELELERLREILTVVKIETRRLAFEFINMTIRGQKDAIQFAKTTIPQFNQSHIAAIEKIDLEATRAVAAQGGNRSFLARLFSQLNPVISDGIQKALTNGVATGLPPRQIAADINKVFPNAAARSMTIARTETNNAFRRAAQDFYKTTPGVVGYVYVSALDLRTCPICWGLHGKFFKVKTPFATHPNCRCTLRPVFRGEKFDDNQTGVAKFAKLTAAQQKTILGTARFGLYNGGVGLPDMIELKQTEFGGTRVLRPVSYFDDIAT